MESKLLSEISYQLVGMSFYGDPFSNAGGWDEDNEIGRLWKRFMSSYMKDPSAISHKTSENVFFELHLEDEKSRETGRFEVFVGLPVNELEEVPLEYCVKLLPRVEYCCFTLCGLEIREDWGARYQQILDEMGYEPAFTYTFQYYDSRFKSMEKIDESELDLYVPVKKKV